MKIRWMPLQAERRSVVGPVVSVGGSVAVFLVFERWFLEGGDGLNVFFEGGF